MGALRLKQLENHWSSRCHTVCALGLPRTRGDSSHFSVIVLLSVCCCVSCVAVQYHMWWWCVGVDHYLVKVGWEGWVQEERFNLGKLSLKQMLLCSPVTCRKLLKHRAYCNDAYSFYNCPLLKCGDVQLAELFSCTHTVSGMFLDLVHIGQCVRVYVSHRGIWVEETAKPTRPQWHDSKHLATRLRLQLKPDKVNF